MTVNLSNLFPKSFYSDFKKIMNHDFTEYTEAGGRGSCKSSFISLCVIMLILKNKDFNAVILRKTANTLRDSVFTQLKWACEQLGVIDLFSFTFQPLQAVYKPTGQTIFFRGSDDPLKIKSIKPSRGYTAITWFEELAEFSPSDVMTVKLSTMRGGSKYYIFNSFNPPSSVRNWVNEYVRKPKSNALTHISDYRTVNPSWLGDAFLFEAEEMKRTNERAYRNIFLGEPTGTGSNVFENVELRTLTDEEINSIDNHYYGIDWGYFPDPFIWCAFAYEPRTKVLYIYDELKLYKHGNQAASDKLTEYLKAKNPDFNFMNDRITADSAEPKSCADFRSYGWNLRPCVKFPHSLESGVKWLQSLSKIVIDPNRCPESADEFSLWEYDIDKRTGEILSGVPDGQEDHAIAAARYALESVWQKKGN